MHNMTINLHIYALKSANSATFPLITPLTPYHSTRYDLYKYTESKNLLNNTKLNHEQKFSLPVFPIYENLNSLQSFLPPSHMEQKRSTHKKTFWVCKVFVCGGGVLNKWNVTRHKTKMDLVVICTLCTTSHNKRTPQRNTTKVVIIACMLIIAPRRKLAYITPYYIRYV